ncbi:tRNA preQ1(34) S-adenosylmethionine ribosyltransferase-isomerase QueA [Lichenicola cladoniae]|uniref:S-adenosylmethionine:tRNA ribosyltransferase-isomerase n=1 Tax=Lichenicola cladoniae TaxID=1484109 RepID=A0A6M8HSU9_9PROT|nr:tRNA preQ1(34) S-adenosylmethionine ribosyltransferase-isomerase QueA [Lichenicola cladoniae]NPD65618.1 tRNA preQ1(34) S-adenosylmethionine ribosyltransferase-isomerase QueA [Acetobacteraceae bacterium]QKE91346.1 tRNA preQ1(34) S-adenosylmethionine ribosyltransferase-isomerase QueA [Lichenicola cladoniae]
MSLLASDFDFHLPPERIAHVPARPRESARLLDVGPDRVADRIVAALPSLLRAGDLVVANDTRVIPAQLTGFRGDARIGITLDRILADGSWHVLVRNARRLHDGDMLRFPGSTMTAEVVSREEGGAAVLRFSEDAGFDRFLREVGRLALPPYIERPDGPTADDTSDYQTVFAQADGAVAAPTAGLHFTPSLLAETQAAGIGHLTVTLHVGAGTFLPMREDAVSAHRMHAERGIVSADAAAAINAARARGGRIVAVGTTSLRLLESAVDADGQVQPFDGETSLFIKPGHRFRTADLLLTNFHLPRSTLFMLVCAFAGRRTMLDAYAHAVATGYRFYSYGDACLLQHDPAAS